MRVLQLSDTHISRERPSRTADLAACIAQIGQLDVRPDVVVHTGDVSHDGHREEYEVARGLLDGLGVPYFVIPGNRDDRKRLLEVFADGSHLRTGMEFIQYAVDQFSTRLIFVDTVSGESNKGRLCPERLHHLESMLAAAPSRPTVVFMHHPPFVVPPIPDPHQYEVWSEAEAFQALVGRHPQIGAIHCGHVHRRIAAEIGAVPAACVTCVAVDLRKGVVEADRALPVFKVLELP